MTQGKKKNAELLVVYLLQEGFPIEGQSGLRMGKLDKKKNSEIHWRKPATDHRGLMPGGGTQGHSKSLHYQAGKMLSLWHVFLRCESKSANTYQPHHSPQTPPDSCENEV